MGIPARDFRDRATACILAGGRSERMQGVDKQTLVLGGERLVERQIRRLGAWFREIVVVTARPGLYETLPVRTTKDILSGFGPLSGLHAALVSSGTPWVFLLACDMTGFDPGFCAYCLDLLEGRIAGYPAPERSPGSPVAHAPGRSAVPAACVAAWRDHFEPFHAVYSRSLAEPIEALTRTTPEPGTPGPTPSIGDLLLRTPHIRVPEEVVRRFTPDWSLFRNINTREDLREAGGSTAQEFPGGELATFRPPR